MKVIRVIEYEGDQDWVERTLRNSYVKGTMSVGAGRFIRELLRHQTSAFKVDEEVQFLKEADA